jgi:hypothetical protein
MLLQNEDGLTVLVIQFHSFREVLEPGSLAEKLISHHLCLKGHMMLPVATQNVMIHGYMVVLQNVLSLPDMDHSKYFVFATSLMQTLMPDKDITYGWNGVLFVQHSSASSFC